jgi:predicted MPP superfamily phosphohydrolase
MSSMAATTPIATPRRRILPRIPGRVYFFLALYFGTTWGVILLLANGVVPDAGLWVAALAAFTILPLLLMLIRGGFGPAPGRAYRLFVLRPFWYLQLMLPLVAIAGITGVATGSLFGAGLLFGRELAATVAVALAVFFLAGYIGSRRLVVRDVTADIAGLPAGLDGTRIVQLSDLHIGPHLPASKLERIVSTVQSIAPDLIAVTGDLVDDHAEDTERYADALGSLSAPLGVYVIAGNHDVYAGWNDVARRLKERLGNHVLVNQSHTITRNGARLAIAGTGDPAAGHDAANGGVDIAATLEQVPAGVPVLALAHNPALWPALAKRGVALTLSGHTHWGQFALPRLGWSMASPFLQHAMGGHAEGSSLLYINPGTGYWGLPFRLGAWAEITRVTLRSAPESHLEVGPVHNA